MPELSRDIFRVTLLGTGAPPPVLDRFGPSTLVEVGAGRRTLDSVKAALVAGERSSAGVTMPPEGLSLQWIRYGEPGSGRQRQLQQRRDAIS